MSVLKISDYRLAQDRVGGFVYFRVINSDGSIGDPLNGKWKTIPFAAFPSLVGILSSGNAIYDAAKDMFGASTRERNVSDSLRSDEVNMLPSRKLTKQKKSAGKKPGAKKTHTKKQKS